MLPMILTQACSLVSLQDPKQPLSQVSILTHSQQQSLSLKSILAAEEIQIKSATDP
jgi:hypothetical protein